MGLENVNVDLIEQILKKVMKSHEIFLNYKLVKVHTQKISSPTKIVEYNFSFISEEKERQILIRINDFYNYQNLVVWITNLESQFLNKIDVKLYFLEFLKNKGIKQQLIFKSKSEIELDEYLKHIFKYLLCNCDEQFREIINGKKWIEMPFDWGDYK